MIVADLSPRLLERRLSRRGLRLRTGPVVTNIRSRLKAVVKGIAFHYSAHRVEAESTFADFHVSVEHPLGIRRWIEPQAVFRFDADVPFAPLPASQAVPMLEWGLNWCVSSQSHQYLTLHAAVLERDGLALVLPAPSGSGKSTLCAALAFRGWRLLSDELAVIDPDTGLVIPLPRPISLKNASIELIRGFAPGAAFGPVVRDTIKGSVAYIKPPAEAVSRADERPMPRWIVLPGYTAGAELRLDRLSKARALMQLIDNAFNFNVHGRAAFELLSATVDRSECYALGYSSLDEAVAMLDRMACTTAGSG